MSIRGVSRSSPARSSIGCGALVERVWTCELKTTVRQAHTVAGITVTSWRG